MTIIHVFPGQGSQFKGMGEGLFAQYPRLVEVADHILGYSVETLCLQDPQRQLGQTRYTQPALFVVSALSHLARQDSGKPPPDWLAGHSLGEFSALFAAGAFDFETGLRIVQRRAELMGRVRGGAMAAVLGLPAEDLGRLLRASPYRTVVVANHNSATQVILSGAEAEIDALAPLVEAEGARHVRLNVSAAFHSSFMAEAQADFARYLEGVDLAPLRVPVVANVSAQPYPRSGYRELLAQQMTQPVRWYESISALCGLPQAEFEEIGPGIVLSKIFAEIRKQPADVLPFAERYSLSPGELPAAAPEASVQRPAALAHETASRQLLLMFGGEGAQRLGMGESLYRNHPAYRDSFDQCRAIVQRHAGFDLVQLLYQPPDKTRPLDRALHVQPAIVSIGIGAAAMLAAEGLRAAQVFGHGLGEFSAAIVAGALSLEEGLRLVVEQARLIERLCPQTATLEVQDSLDPVAQACSRLAGCELAGRLSARHTLVTGPPDRVGLLSRQLALRGIAAEPVPLRQGLGRTGLEALRKPWHDLLRGMTMQEARLPLSSAAMGSRITQPTVESLWRALASAVDLPRMLRGLDARGLQAVDLSPAGYLKRFTPRSPGAADPIALFGRMGHEIQQLQALRS